MAGALAVYLPGRPSVEWDGVQQTPPRGRKMVVRAYLHRGRLGDPAAAEAARVLAAEVDNPALLRNGLTTVRVTDRVTALSGTM